MDALWDQPQRRVRGRDLKRDEIFEFICQYALEHNGVTPGFLQIARQFNLKYGTVYGHVSALSNERLLRIEDRHIVVEDSYWKPPARFKG
jgi:hypothetical protein